MANSSAVDIEKKNLEAHVEICAVRYSNLEHKLTQLQIRMNSFDDRMDTFEQHLLDIKDAVTAGDEKSRDKTLTIVLSVFGIVLAALIGIFANTLTK
jgi:hypothetical protein